AVADADRAVGGKERVDGADAAEGEGGRARGAVREMRGGIDVELAAGNEQVSVVRQRAAVDQHVAGAGDGKRGAVGERSRGNRERARAARTLTDAAARAPAGSDGGAGANDAQRSVGAGYAAGADEHLLRAVTGIVDDNGSFARPGALSDEKNAGGWPGG